MDIQKLKLVCFSPTGTTGKIVQAIARGTGLAQVELIDITKPSARCHVLHTDENELLVIGVPVYMGRVPALLSGWLHSIIARNTPAAGVVVYGNRDYENALLELEDNLAERGCRPIAGAAFIGEHSFSSDELPSSPGRPDADDLYHAEMFGRKIMELLHAVPDDTVVTDVPVPGSRPYGGTTDLWHIDFIAVDDRCTQCGRCAEGCPVGAVDTADSRIIDKDKCTLCCACIRHCPQKAKSMKPGPMKDAAIRCTKFTERKEPECFFSEAGSLPGSE